MAEFSRSFNRYEAEEFIHSWWLTAHETQIPPLDNWRTWMLLGGRGAGKTRAGAEWLRSIVAKDGFTIGDSAGRVALIGETYQDVRSIMIEGESGLLAVHRKDKRPSWIASRRELIWPNGTIGQVFSANDPEGLRGNQFGAAWCDEFGCPAIDRGSNQPNVFNDGLSSESQTPWFSMGGRDDLIQLRYLQAHLENAVLPLGENNPDNPISNVYSGPMQPPQDMSIWAWDARPYPAFPHYQDLWSDGENWYRGHWLNGRIGTCPLDDLLKTICSDFGLAEPDCEIDGHLQGLIISGQVSARSVVEPLLLLHNIAVSEVDGRLKFIGKPYLETLEISQSEFVQEENQHRLALSKTSEIELPKEISITHGDIDNGFDSLVSSSRRLETLSDRQMSIEVPVVVGRDKALALANARLRDIWTARDTAQFQLPWKYLMAEPSDLISIQSGSNMPVLFQIQTTTDGLGREIEAVGFSQFEESTNWIKPIALESKQSGTVGRPDVLLMNLPIKDAGSNSQSNIFAAAFASPWADQYAVLTSPLETGFQRVATIIKPATIFELLDPLLPGPIGRWDYSNKLRVRLRNPSSEFQSLSEILVFAGDNAIAVECENGGWEIIQFQHAEVLSPQEWELSGLLRGQLGTDLEMASSANTGASAVVLDDAIVPVPIAQDQVGLDAFWKIGPVSEDIASASYHQESFVFTSAATRPFSPSHLSAEWTQAGIQLSWIRRSRIGADSWQSEEVPLDVANLKFRIEVRNEADDLVRTQEVSQESYLYTELDSDFSSAPQTIKFKVMQLSDTLEAGAPSFLKFKV